LARTSLPTGASTNHKLRFLDREGRKKCGDGWTGHRRLVWQEPARDTSLARMVAGRLAARGAPITCVWTEARLSADTLDIDHTLPWSAWPCGDLWNLAPALRRINQHEKRDRLPSASALARAREPILAWWDEAWNADPALAARFGLEARVTLPIDGAVTPDAVFAGMEWRRLRLQQDQQPPEWAGVRGTRGDDRQEY
jgi:hypothetical protein